MSFRDHENFQGLTTELYFSNKKRFSASRNATPLVTGGTFTCHKISPLFPFIEKDVQCAQKGALDATETFDLRATIFTNFVANTTQLLSARALIIPTPDYVQVKVDGTNITVAGGSDAVCLAESNLQDCPDPQAGTVTWDIFTPTSVYPYGQPASAPGQFFSSKNVATSSSGSSASGLIGSFLRRAPDGSTYAGNPLNDAVDTLIPWGEFVAATNYMLTFKLSTADLYKIRINFPVVTVTPWYVVAAAVSPPFICLL